MQLLLSLSEQHHMFIENCMILISVKRKVKSGKQKSVNVNN